MTALTLRVSLPCPLNRLYRSVLMPGWKWPRTILSARARVCSNILMGEILKQTERMAKPIFAGPVSIADYTIVPRDRRPVDFDAYDKQLFDCLAKAGVLANDKQIKHGGSKEILPPKRPGYISITITDLP